MAGFWQRLNDLLNKEIIKSRRIQDPGSWNQEDWKLFEKHFNHGLLSIVGVLVATLLIGGLLAYALYRLGPVFGPIVSAYAVLLTLVVVGLVFGRAVKLIKVHRKRNQPSLRCAYCKQPSSKPEVISCPSCSSVYHRECYTLNNGCTTFACAKAAHKEVHIKKERNQL
jgi:hypothetical protein